MVLGGPLGSAYIPQVNWRRGAILGKKKSPVKRGGLLTIDVMIDYLIFELLLVLSG